MGNPGIEPEFRLPLRAFGDGAVLRRGDLHPIRAKSSQHGTACKHEPHSYARSAMLDARLVTPRPRDVDGWNLPTRTEGRGKEAARGLLKVHALAHECVRRRGVCVSCRGSQLRGRIHDRRSREMAPPCGVPEPILDLFFVPGTRRSGDDLTRIEHGASRI